MRLDWFLPAMRKTPDGSPAMQTRFGQAVRNCLPASLRSDHHTKIRGPVRRLLRWLGTSWLYSPVRRIAQAICFILFLFLFFYVCWPYTASPRPSGPTFAAWQFSSFDQDTGEIVLQADDAPAWILEANAPLYLIDSGAATPMVVGRFRAGQLSDQEFRFVPETVDAETLAAVLVASGTWTVSEQPPDVWPSHYADDLARKEWVPADVFLVIDPLVSISTAIASRQWVWSIACAAAILFVCVLVPRGFCGYICPLGTLIDLFDWSIGSRLTRFRLRQSASGWWVHTKYYLLIGSLICAAFGVLVTGYIAAIPVVTRGFLFAGEPIQSGLMRGWHLVPLPSIAAFVSFALFLGVLALGLLQPRFWCKYVCPSGAVFSIGNLFRATERKVESSCIHCNKCIEVCPFDAIKPDFTTRVTDCTQCQTCGGVCPTHAIKFVERGNVVELKVENDPPTGESAWGRRGFLSAAVGTAASITGAAMLTGVTKSFGANLNSNSDWLPVRPPGSVPEQEFLQMCIRCGECFKACPNNVLQPMAFQQGLEGLWTPHVVADWAGCESSCNACGQVCPTGAIRALPLEEKRYARMGLAIVNTDTCLPLAGREACQLCVDECNAAGYEAIEFTQVHTETDDSGAPIEGTGFLAPVVVEDKCVGCGLCQTRCYGINVEQRSVLDESAIIIVAGKEFEDRMLSGSYRKAHESRTATDEHRAEDSADTFYVPTDANENVPPETDVEDDPFGLQ